MTRENVEAGVGEGGSGGDSPGPEGLARPPAPTREEGGDGGEPGGGGAPSQGEIPFAMVAGAPLTELPRDLYIPPDALEVFLEAFEGPLDLLLYLIRRHRIDILDIPIAEVTRQYVQYVELMKELRLELAAEYLVMAAVLAEIKSRMLLPRMETEGEEEDPRAELVRRLQEYERYKQAAEDLDGLPRVGRDVFPVTLDVSGIEAARVLPRVSLAELTAALADVLVRAELATSHRVMLEPLSVRERMSQVLERLRALAADPGARSLGPYVEFRELFPVEEGRRGVVVTFLALLELAREALIEMVQAVPFGPIRVRAAG